MARINRKAAVALRRWARYWGRPGLSVVYEGEQLRRGWRLLRLPSGGEKIEIAVKPTGDVCRSSATALGRCEFRDVAVAAWAPRAPQEIVCARGNYGIPVPRDSVATKEVITEILAKDPTAELDAIRRELGSELTRGPAGAGVYYDAEETKPWRITDDYFSESYATFEEALAGAKRWREQCAN